MNVRTICLGYLSLREATGYEIKKDFEDGLFCHFLEASYGSIYPALNQLAVDGLVTVREEEQSGKPDKKVYAISQAGIATLRKALNVLPAPDKFKSEFLFMMLLQQHITPELRMMAIEKQIKDMRVDLANLEQCRAQQPGNPDGEFVAGYGEAVLTAGVTYLEHKLAELVAQNKRTAAE
jgi:PadR family transcriptional regulator, regulatory protein AphA